MLAAGLLLLAAQGSAESVTNEASAALIEATAHMEAQVTCNAGREGEALRARYDRLRVEALGLLHAPPRVGVVVGSGSHCRPADRRRAAAALDRLAAAVAAKRAAMPGLWFGPLHLCGGAVLAVEEGKDETDLDVVLIRFSPAMAEAVRAETAARVNTPLPLLLDGRTLIEPVVREPIAGGAISISGGDPASSIDGGAAGLRAAAARPCEG